MKAAVDSSAIIAFLLNEPEAIAIQEFLLSNEPVVIGPVVLEATMVLAGRNRSHPDTLISDLLDEVGAEIMPFDATMMSISQQAFLRFGKGRHPARLNFGDCMSYALAKARGIPLLYKGGDFALTDIEPAL